MSYTQDNEEDRLEPEQAWCAECDCAVDIDNDGYCVTCRDNGDAGIVEGVVFEAVPQTSPRSIECPTCGNDPGEFCHPSVDGEGFNHSARVELHEREHGVIAARSRHA